MHTRGLGYVGFTAPDPATWLEFATDIVGMMPARAIPGEAFPLLGAGEPASRGAGRGPDGSVYLKIDDHQWRIAIHPGEPGLAYFGLEFLDAPALEESVGRAEREGAQVEWGTAEDARERSVRGLARLRDPDGRQVELFYGPVSDRNFLSPRGCTFVTGGLGLGHLLLLVPDMEKSVDFYTRVLGFRLTDFMNFGPGMSVHFLRCTPRHHSIGMARVGDVVGVTHLMVEVDDVDDVGRALDRATSAGHPITSTIGRHKNDQMLSFYMRTPSLGIELEVGCDGLSIDEDTWVVNEFVEGDTWGHHGLTVEAMQQAGDGSVATG